MPNGNIEALKKGYDAFGAGDLEAALSVFDDSAEWIVNGESMIRQESNPLCHLPDRAYLNQSHQSFVILSS